MHSKLYFVIAKHCRFSGKILLTFSAVFPFYFFILHFSRLIECVCVFTYKCLLYELWADCRPPPKKNFFLVTSSRLWVLAWEKATRKKISRTQNSLAKLHYHSENKEQQFRGDFIYFFCSSCSAAESVVVCASIIVCVSHFPK